MAKIGDRVESYCCACERTSVHEYIEDNIFEFGLECLVCSTVWESTDPEDCDIPILPIEPTKAPEIYVRIDTPLGEIIKLEDVHITRVKK